MFRKGTDSNILFVFSEKSASDDIYFLGLENVNKHTCSDISCSGTTAKWHHNTEIPFDTSLWSWIFPGNDLFTVYVSSTEKKLRTTFASYNNGGTNNVLLCQFDCNNIGSVQTIILYIFKYVLWYKFLTTVPAVPATCPFGTLEPIPDGYNFVYNDKYYRKNPVQKSYNDAKDECQSTGGWLPEFRTAQEYQDLLYLMGKF